MDGAAARTKLRSGAPRELASSLAALDKRLQLRRRAREDGARNLPLTDAADLSEAERAAVSAMAEARQRVDQSRAAVRAETERRLRALAPAPQDFAGPAMEARLGLKQIEGRLARDWAQATEQARDAARDFHSFKQRHNLHRGAHYPSAPLLQAGLLFLAALFEALFSATLFAEDDARGLLGGAVTAIGLSGANVTLGFLAGFLGLRYLQHRALGLKAAGATAFLFFTTLALMLNLFAADWRDQMAIASGALAARGADANFHLWSLLQLNSPQAIILLMLGAGVWVFATLKGYSGFDDPYPEFGKMDRSAAKARDELSAFRAEARLELEAPIDAARATITARLDKMRAEHDAMSRAYDEAALTMEGFDSETRLLDDIAAGAVQLYRQENCAARTTPAPAYFADTPPAAGPALDALGQSGAIVTAARDVLAASQREAAAALESLAAELEGATHRLDSASAFHAPAPHLPA